MDSAPSPPKRRKKGTLPPWVVLVLVVLFGGAGGAYYYASLPKSGVSNVKLEADVRASVVAGMPKEDAKKWLESKGYAVSAIQDGGANENGYRTRVRNDTRLEEVELEVACWYDKKGKITDVAVSKIKVENT
ncbi:MAG TPA: hypothetical protein VMZ71_11760, partial [Gemmataceae bacterium]|nr:hypothetical protein [Gemmataceae bacterium]